MIGMSETTDRDGNAVVGVATTPEEWRAYLMRYGDLYVQEADYDELVDLLEEEDLEAYDRGEHVRPWLGETPAAQEDVVAAEERLGVRFPPGLRAFFLTSNGWTCLANSWVGGSVYPCDRVTWMRDSESGDSVIEIYDGIPGNEDDVQLFRRSLEIAHDEDFWLLDPTDTGPDGEWAAYTFSPKYGNPSKYPSFFALFHSGYEAMQR
ncbi:SMI1/KNR4 family protein [Streptomyces sp. NPDC101181]|uniref:SMI1/KNR4 family protein n=1 Tax=Streptomyces sp. NPDC101181 TaxID=3366125 RepID=UPI0037FE11C0